MLENFDKVNFDHPFDPWQADYKRKNCIQSLENYSAMELVWNDVA